MSGFKGFAPDENKDGNVRFEIDTSEVTKLVKKYKKDFVTMQQSEGRVSPKLWGNPPPKERKKKS